LLEKNIILDSYGTATGGDSQGNELLESRCIAIYDETNEEDKIVDFEITENDENILQTIVKVTFIS
jgi:hypothetical protein